MSDQMFFNTPKYLVLKYSCKPMFPYILNVKVRCLQNKNKSFSSNIINKCNVKAK